MKKLPNKRKILKNVSYNSKTGTLTKIKTNKVLRGRNVNIDGEVYQISRIIYFLETGKEPEVVQHKDANFKNNHISNLKGIKRCEILQPNQNTLNKAKRFIDDGYSGLQIYGNLMKGEIAHPAFKKYLGDYYALKQEELKKTKEEEILKSFKEHDGIQKYVLKDLKISAETYNKVLKKNNISKPDNLTGNNHNLQHAIVRPDFFEKIDSEDKSYFLGLMYADGYTIIKENKPNSTGYTSAISLQEQDKHILETFSDLIFGKDNLSKITYKNNRGKDAYVLRIHNKKICQDLIKLGCVPKKSLILKFPSEQQVPRKYLRHFIRGYFDGDGSVGKYKVGKQKKSPKKGQFSFFGSEDFIKSLKGHLDKELNYNFCIYNGSNNSNMWTLACGAQFIFDKMADYLYNKSTLYLTRKRNKFYEN